MDTSILAYLLLGATMVVPGIIIFAIAGYSSARKRIRPRRRVRRPIPRPL
jgi:hypothetical protein